jgi:hypothetical protein
VQGDQHVGRSDRSAYILNDATTYADIPFDFSDIKPAARLRRKKLSS